MDIMFDLLKALFVGGMICVIGQLLIDLTKLTPGRILVGFVLTGVVLGAIGVYEPLVDWAGCGATVPLTGFGYALVRGTKAAIAEDGLIGVLTGALTAGAGGITACILCGLVVSAVTKPRTK